MSKPPDLVEWSERLSNLLDKELADEPSKEVCYVLVTVTTGEDVCVETDGIVRLVTPFESRVTTNVGHGLMKDVILGTAEKLKGHLT